MGIAFLALLLLISTILISELLHWRAFRSDRVKLRANTSCAIVALGFRARNDGGLHPIQRWRTQIAVRTLRRFDPSTIIFTGGRKHNQHTEAQVMACYARALGVPARKIMVETKSRNTRQNMDFALNLAKSFDFIAIASDPIHAARARRFIIQKHPDLSDRIVFADNYHFLEKWWLKIPTAAFELQLALRYRVRAT